jgi:hypothetical protein
MLTKREQFQAILIKHGLTQAGAAALICQQTERPCSVRAVRSWLNDPNGVSSRPLPDWALLAIKKATDDNSTS